MHPGLPVPILLFSTVLWTACLATRDVIVIGTTSFPAGKRGGRCAIEVLGNYNANLPGRAMSRCLNARTTLLVPADRKESIVIGTTSYPSGKRSEKCARMVAESKTKSPGRAMFRCMNALTTVLAASSSVLIGTVSVPEDSLTMKCLALLRNTNTSMPGWYVDECRKTTTTVVVPGSPTVVTNGRHFISKHVNDDALLSCTVTDKGQHTVSWMSILPRTMPIFHNTQRVHMDPRYRVEKEGNSTYSTYNMRINRISTDDEGVYACQVNTMPKPTFINITLQVVVAPTIIGIVPISGATPSVDNNYRFAYNESDDVSLSCEAGGSPKPLFDWRSMPTGQLLSTNSTLAIPNIQRDQGGFFKCTADNGYLETAQEQWIEITVQFKPEVIAEERDIRLGEDDYYQLRCNVKSRPPATYRWLKDNQLQLDGIAKRSQTLFVLVGVKPDMHYGVYKCQATNILGTSEDEIEVSGRLLAPKIVSDPVGVRRHSYKLQWIMGNSKQQGLAGYTPIDAYIMSYNGWWFQENEMGVVEKVYSHSRDSPLEVDITHDPELIRQVYVLRDLRANVTYEVILKGYNKYGDGDNTTFTFYTALEKPSSTAQVNTWQTTTDWTSTTTAEKGSAKQWRSAGISVHDISTQTLTLVASACIFVQSFSLAEN